MKRSARGSLGFAVVLLLLAGCAGTKSASTAVRTTTPSPPMTVGKVCQPIESANQTLTQLSGMGANTTVGEVRTAEQKLAEELGLIGALPAAHGNAYDTLRITNEQLAAAVAAAKGVPDTTTIGQAGPELQALKQKVTAAQPATTQLATAFNCKP